MVFAWRKNSGRPEWKIGTFASQRGPPIFLKARCARTSLHIALRQPRATKRKAATACIIAHASDSRAAPSSCGRFDACKMRSVRSLGTCGAQHQLRGWPTGIAASQSRISRKGCRHQGCRVEVKVLYLKLRAFFGCFCVVELKIFFAGLRPAPRWGSRPRPRSGRSSPSALSGGAHPGASYHLSQLHGCR